MSIFNPFSKSRSLSVYAKILLVCSSYFSTFTKVTGQEIIDPETLFNGISEGSYDAIIDVRSESEWNSGHIPGATHIEALQTMSFPPFPALLDQGCNSVEKTIVVYCRSGARAGAAINNLLQAGYSGTLLNGQGVMQWQDAGYALTDTESSLPPCYIGPSPFPSLSPTKDLNINDSPSPFVSSSPTKELNISSFPSNFPSSSTSEELSFIDRFVSFFALP